MTLAQWLIIFIVCAVLFSITITLLTLFIEIMKHIFKGDFFDDENENL